MCAVAGVVSFSECLCPQSLGAMLARMLRAMAHRGPDGSATTALCNNRVHLGHRRLAVVDPRPIAAQPMASACGRYWLCANAEIYNYRDLRRRLAHRGYRFKTESDSEVLVAMISVFGLADTLEAISGMFAFACVDLERRRLSLVRDRVGEKPMYYGFDGERLLFASEMQAFKAAGQWQTNVDTASVSEFLRFGYIRSPYTLLDDIRKLCPGEHLQFALDDAYELPRAECFWRAPASDWQPQDTSWDLSAWRGEFSQRFRNAIDQQLNADVPVGLLLSGGIDSALVSSVAARRAGDRLTAYTMGFDDRRFDESDAAARTARSLGLNHQIVRCDEKQLTAWLPPMLSGAGEPLADPSLIIADALFAAVGRDVKVVLSGDGGDELFGGYTRYRVADRLWSRISGHDRGPRFTSRLLDEAPLRGLHWADRVLARIGRLGVESSARRFGKLRRALRAADELDLYLRLAETSGGRTISATPVGRSGRRWLSAAPSDASRETIVLRHLQRDFENFLPDCVLHKIDRAAMAHGVEVRAPLLDSAIVSHALGAPRVRLHGVRENKRWMQALLPQDERFPKGVTKRGFSAPIASWLRGGLAEWMNDTLSDSQLGRQGLLDPKATEAARRAHLDQREDCAGVLLSALALTCWRMQWP